MPKREVSLDPFKYGTWDVVTTVLQIAVVAASLLLAWRGETIALLGLGALAGGSKGDLLTSLYKLARGLLRNSGTMLILAVVGVMTLPACGTTIAKQFVVDSQAAVVESAGDYFAGCDEVTIAPAFTIGWEDKVQYGGGLYAGCTKRGHLLEFHCRALEDTETGEVTIACDPLSRWHREVDGDGGALLFQNEEEGETENSEE